MAPTDTTTPWREWLPIFVLFVIAVAGRLLPHPPNVTPLGGATLFGAAVISRRWLAFILPFVVLYSTDLILNNTLYAQYYDGFMWGINHSVYLGFLAVVLLGFIALRNHKHTPERLVGTTLVGSLLFFLITNFFVWYGDVMGLYPNNFAGLIACYVAALPFLFNSLLGDLFFVGLLFSGYAWYQRSYLATA